MRNQKLPHGFAMNKGVAVPSEVFQEELKKQIQDIDGEDLEVVDPAAAPDVSSKATEVCETFDGPGIELYQASDFAALSENVLARRSIGDLQERNRALVKALAKKGPRRRLQTIPEDWRTIIDGLRKSFPNSTCALDHIQAGLAFSALTTSVIAFPPLLLEGPAGAGKSTFAKAVADAFSMRFIEHRMETTDTGAALAGSQQYWGNTQTGLVFETLIADDVANPLIFVDELEKGGQDDRHASSLSGLYALLDQESATRFKDSSFPGLPLDASRICWLAAVNDRSRLPAPILDRMFLAPMPHPTPAQIDAIAAAILEQLLRSVALDRFSRQLTPATLARLRRRSPRRIRAALLTAIGGAVYDRRLEIRPDDIPDEAERNIGRIGFIEPTDE
jgi:ATP-dependent Lon protease